METKKSNPLEREYTISLKEKVRSVPRYKKTNKAVRTVKEFLVRHMKIYDGDLNKIKIDKYLNEYLWFRGIRNPPRKVKVKARKEGEFVKVELVDLPEKLKFKKIREEKREAQAKKSEKKKPELKKSNEVQSEDKNKDGIEDKNEETEKKSAVIEAGQEFEKAEAKKLKHTAKTKTPAKEREEERTSKLVEFRK